MVIIPEDVKNAAPRTYGTIAQLTVVIVAGPFILPDNKMQISKKRSPFNNSWITLIAEHEGTKIEFDLDLEELIPFANMLIDVADDCINAHEKITEQEFINKALVNKEIKIVGNIYETNIP